MWQNQHCGITSSIGAGLLRNDGRLPTIPVTTTNANAQHEGDRIFVLEGSTECAYWEYDVEHALQTKSANQPVGRSRADGSSFEKRRSARSSLATQGMQSLDGNGIHSKLSGCYTSRAQYP